MGYWPSARSRWLDIGQVLFLRVLWTSTSSRSINSQKKPEAKTQPSCPSKRGHWRIYYMAFGVILLAEYSGQSRAKVCERAAHLQLVRSLQDHSTIHPFQSVNRKSHSTETAILHSTDEILKNMDEKRISVLVLLDMTKAFILLAKLRRIGISLSALAWFSSYLSSRKQVERIGNTLSEQL